MSLKAKLQAMSAKLTSRCGGGDPGPRGAGRGGEEASARCEKRRGGGDASGKKPKKRRKGGGDPSARYLEDPLRAPIVGRWRSYFGSGRAVSVGATAGWRTVAKLVARRVGGRVLLGLFEPGTHEVRASGASSAAHSRALNEAIAALEAAAGALRVAATGDDADTGALSYVGLAEETTTHRVSVALVFNATRANRAALAAAEAVLREVRSEAWLHSLHVHWNAVSKHDNAIYGRGGPETWRALFPPAAARSGDDAAEAGFAYAEAGCTREAPLDAAIPLFFAPQCFRQANLAQFFEIVKALAPFVPRGATVVELYGGVATIGAHLLRAAASVACSDENPWNDHCVALLKARLPPDLAAKLSYDAKPAAAIARAGKLDDADVVLVDPPRKGLCDDVLAALARPNRRGKRPAKRRRRLIYVSCGFDALQRDLDALKPRWKLAHAEGHVLFPGADHIETLAVLDEQP